jgi:IMP cyclohydrolase
MAIEQVRDVLAGNPYPGRGVVWARTLDGAVCGAYFLTGRSPASQARELRIGGGDLVVAATQGPGGDPLRHYVAARERGDWLVFGNGEQVTQVADRLGTATPPQALAGLSYEPDPPIFTPRITVVADRATGRAWFGAARRSRGGRDEADLLVLSLAPPAVGDVVVMTTYRSSGDTSAVTTAEPYVEARTSAADRRDLLATLWDALNPELRVAAAAFTPGALADAAILGRGEGR